MNMKTALLVAAGGVASFLGFHAYQNMVAGKGSIPGIGSAAAQPAIGRLQTPAPLGGNQSPSYTGSAPIGQRTGNGAPPSSGVLTDAATAIKDGKDAIAAGQAAADLLRSVGIIGGGDDAPSIPDADDFT